MSQLWGGKNVLHHGKLPSKPSFLCPFSVYIMKHAHLEKWAVQRKISWTAKVPTSALLKIPSTYLLTCLFLMENVSYFIFKSQKFLCIRKAGNLEILHKNKTVAIEFIVPYTSEVLLELKDYYILYLKKLK